MDDLSSAIQALEKLAAGLRQKQRRQDEIDHGRARVRAHRQRRTSAAAILGDKINEGMSEDRAIDFVAQITGIRPEQLHPLLAPARRQAERGTLFDRNREIMALARKGFTNAKIAVELDRLGYKMVSPMHIGRIINREKKR